VFVGNPIDNTELGVAYSRMDSVAYYQEIDRENRRKMEYAIEQLGKLARPDDHLLDVGTGDGLFVEMLYRAGFTNISAHEIPGQELPRLTPLVRSLYRDFDYQSIPAGSVDVVTLLDVVEHVPDPGYLMRACHRLLRSAGRIYFHTPVVSRTDRLMHWALRIPLAARLGRIWQAGRTSIFHLANYSPRALELILRRAGFTEIEIRVKNELSWPLERYVRVYLLKKQRLPESWAGAIAPFCAPLLATDLWNANKAIVTARKP
jgi:2-polyprenyl-3-methyl-5-hydroxy-6-metoxy-1,4-benzoquinol methylase